ncbi:mannose/fructose/sorbose family PTS transporter subunit IIC [Levilactobacillus namurensis]|uniref:mannose/fructose/sorbose family PTS transporter subunit IIC n=1 Tax=Levilactobacillus namurensis TaxID=380393 RepID=UPI00222E98FF|nr:mannose/fructose/sorbose family PTS transporter subunit IIC [Levilactobacillus namurensis]MCW3779470.1 mannose/fructose/sorbose family PTS transporter subunit IIC [Levilactobacillus namurensis]MDT7017930.1 mannose/fructose/sorbose family PTS transporter subunit IIC [Levilactobacillus namurensis]WNN65070.1 mannose/fructose/sorbose family PTS transporter subunit IIC [Levilactobacillus namurensis]
MTGAIIAILIIAFLAGIEGVADEWEFQQPIVACTLVGLAVGQPLSGVTLGATLQLVTLGWMNIGAAVAPDPALAAVVAAWWVSGPAHLPVAAGVILALPLAWVGQVLTRLLRRLIVPLVAQADQAAAVGDLHRITRLHLYSAALQGLRVMLPTAVLLLIPASVLRQGYQWLPTSVHGGLRVAASMLAVVSFAIVINMMATKQVWPFFFLGFALATDQHLSLIALGMIGVALALIYVSIQPTGRGPQPPTGGQSGDTTEDELDRELDDL